MYTTLIKLKPAFLIFAVLTVAIALPTQEIKGQCGGCPEIFVYPQSWGNDSCNACIGFINLCVIGNDPFTYEWDGPNGYHATTEDIYNLCSGEYSVTITDENGTTKIFHWTVNEDPCPPCQINGYAWQLSPATCQVGGKGRAQGLNGVPPYRYYWSNGDSTNIISNLAPGTYTVTIIDQNDCFMETSVIINGSTGLSITGEKTNTSCGKNNGSININVTGGTPTYSYIWSNGTTFEDQSNLTAGSLAVTVTDATGCKAFASFNITGSTAPTTNLEVIHASCLQNNGSILATGSNGIAPYQFMWTGPNNFTGNGAGGNAHAINALAPGIYNVTMIDATGCEKTDTAIIVNNGTPIFDTVYFKSCEKALLPNGQFVYSNDTVQITYPSMSCDSIVSYIIQIGQGGGVCRRDTLGCEKVELFGQIFTHNDVITKFDTTTYGCIDTTEWHVKILLPDTLINNVHACGNLMINGVFVTTDTTFTVPFQGNVCANGLQIWNVTFNNPVIATKNWYECGILDTLQFTAVSYDPISGCLDSIFPTTVYPETKASPEIQVLETCDTNLLNDPWQHIVVYSCLPDTIKIWIEKETEEFSENTVLCTNDTLNWFNKIVTGPGSFSTVITNAEGCKEKHTLNVSTITGTVSTTETSTCVPSNVGTSDTTIVTNGICSDMYITKYTSWTPAFETTIVRDTCVMNVPPSENIVQVDSCYGKIKTLFQFVPIKGEAIVKACTGPFGDTLVITTDVGCVTETLIHREQLPKAYGSEARSICPGKSFAWNGININAEGTYTAILGAQNGCDSIATIHVTTNELNEVKKWVNVCWGETWINNGDTLTVTDTLTFIEMLPGANDECDTLETLWVIPIVSDTLLQTAYTCDSLEAGITSTIYPSNNGCGILLIDQIVWTPTPEINLGVDSITCTTKGRLWLKNVMPGIKILWSNGETTDTISELNPGMYSVTVSNANGCSEVKFIYIDTPDCPDGPKAKGPCGWRLYPNPIQAQQIGTLEVNGFSGTTSVHILDTDGRRHGGFTFQATGEIEKINFTAPNKPGNYFVVIEDDERNAGGKIVIH